MKILNKEFLFFALLIAILPITWYSRSGVRIEIVNLGPLTMQNVTVDVTGTSYSIGDIPAETSETIKVRPSGDSSVSIKYLDDKGKQQSLPFESYIGYEYSGTITIQVKNGKVANAKQNIKTLPIG